MNQPKFKHGDKCKSIKGVSVFIVKRIDYIVINSDGSGEYKYNDTFWESEMDIYQEPKPKKLYAYSRVLAENAEKVEFLKEDAPFQFVSQGTYKRDPDYDIEYPV